LFETYEVNWWSHGEVFSICAASPIIDEPLRAQVEFSVMLDLLDRKYGPAYRSFETDFSGDLWADLRLGLTSRFVMWSDDAVERRDFDGLTTIIAELVGEPGGKFKAKVSYDLITSLTTDLSAAL
jgi:hypothetical protein